MAALDQVFASHTILTLVHILPALAFVIVVPFALLRRFSSLRWAKRVLYPIGAVVGVSAYAMSRYSIGGWTERSAVLFYTSLFLLSLGRAWLYRMQRQLTKERRWLMRSVVIVLGIATTRPVMAVFFATSPLTHLTPQQFFGVAFWMGFSINWIVIELWLRMRFDSLS
jgi:hypothetical protein